MSEDELRAIGSRWPGDDAEWNALALYVVRDIKNRDEAVVAAVRYFTRNANADVANLIAAVRALTQQVERADHVRCWMGHGLRQIEDLISTPLGREVLISSDEVTRIINETRRQAYAIMEVRNEQPG